MLLLFTLSDYTPDSRFILPKDFEELRQYLNLPAVTEFGSILKDPKARLASEQSLESLRLSFYRLSVADAMYNLSDKAYFFLPGVLPSCQLLLPLPEDIRALNSLCHRFVELEEGAER